MASKCLARAKKQPLTRIAAAVAAHMLLATHAHAGIGFVDALDANGQPLRLQTFFAHSPSGARQGVVPPEANTLFPAGYPGTGAAIRKFVDPLAPLSPFATAANTLSSNPAAQKHIPIAKPGKWINPSSGLASADDYLELAVVEYREQMHSDLPALQKTTGLSGPTGPASGGTVLRGYVQIASPQMEADALLAGLSFDQAFKPLYYPDGRRIQIWDTRLDGSPKLDATGHRLKKDAWAVNDPHYLGPAILALRGTPTRIKFYNLLPVGRAQIDAGTVGAANGQMSVLQRNGDLFIPVDKSLSGAGLGPDGMTLFSQNRIAVHLHGGDTPWISDGTAQQWLAPLGEEDLSHTVNNGFSGTSLAAEINDPNLLPTYLRGASYANVPDMIDPGPGAVTLYYVNGQSARLMWYHDHAVGLTRLNAYAGMAAPYWLTDTEELSLMPPLKADILASGTVIAGLTPSPNPAGTVDTTPIARSILPGLAETLPLVLQDKCFVPKDIALQDARWNTSAWGDHGNLWFPHVYETVQDPAQLNNWNAVGRWHYGPWFWPVFPALYALPSGAFGDETTTPEAWCDTAVVNGVAYPFVDVEPKPYRLRILNGSNDRFFTFNLFQGDPNGALTDSVGNMGSAPDATGLRTWVDGHGIPVAGPVGATYPTEVAMVPASIPSNPCLNGETRFDQTPGGCTPANWPTDGRPGGVPNPATAGPTMYMFGNEGGLLAKLFPIDPLPTNPLYDVGRITVLNINTTGLYLANAERADVVVDFSKYAGQTLIAYNDMNEPVPAGDPRNTYYTGVGDQSRQGGAEDTRPGYGPNTRTLMQFRVKSAVTTPGISFDPAVLAAELPKSYARTQERPVVAQSAYNAAFNPGCPATTAPGTAGCWDDVKAYASIFTGSIKAPQFDFVPGNPGLFDAVLVTSTGSGYITAPTVVFNGGGATTPASATATLKIGQINVVNPGSGYTVAPVVTIAASTGGGGAAARTTLAVNEVQILNGGSGYLTAPAVVFSLPQEPGGVRATGVAVLTAGKVTGITITHPGSGYTAAPMVSFSLPPLGGTRPVATTTCGVGQFILVAPDPANPASAGGGGYVDFTGVTITVTPPTATLPLGHAPWANASAKASGALYDITLNNAGSGYTSVPTLSLVGGSGTGAAAQVGPTGKALFLVKTKAIQELFEPTFGRLNATLGIELPFTSAVTQTTIPLLNIDPATEIINDFETQIWKITHNGVDTHPVHFHLMNVQVINRVGWDGFITAPDPSEVGWKETIKMNPLEDIIVALRPKQPHLDQVAGFGLPQSIRPLDPSQPLGSPFGFTQLNVNTGLPAPVVNAVANFGWEYTWHCHILGHEENDFMRPVVFNVTEAVPLAPSQLSVDAGRTPSAGSTYGGVQLTWTDNARTEYQQRIERAEVLSGSTAAPVFTPLVTLPANFTRYTDTQVEGGVSYTYQVVAIGASGSTTSAPTSTLTPTGLPPAAPADLIANQIGSQVQLSWTDNAVSEVLWTLRQAVLDPVTNTYGPAVDVVPGVISTTTAQRGPVQASIPVTTPGATVRYELAANASANADPATSSAWVAAAPISIPVVLPQSISFGASPPLSVGGSATLSASATSGLAVTLSSNTPTVCTVSGTTVMGLASGTCTVLAQQTGSTQYNPAPGVTQDISVTAGPQNLSFGAVPTVLVKGTGLLSAQSSSGLPVSFSTPSSTCAVSGNTVIGLAAGLCTIVVDQAGDANWLPATPLMQDLTVNVQPQTLRITAPMIISMIGAGGNVTATATSGLPITWNVLPANVCSINGNTITGLSPGVCRVTASQAGDSTYGAAQSVRTITITAQQIQTISMVPPVVVPLGGTSPLITSATSGLPVTVVSLTPLVCSVSPGVISGLTPGICRITASQAGDATWRAATSFTMNVRVR
ncbi:MAG: hypothetical protein AB3X38_10405 [Leptothrix ochracea]|uniref:hypothetical protein n=2 Tax=Leptothrix ochracea TaxID=735331 RepID=UPI0034E213B0